MPHKLESEPCIPSVQCCFLALQPYQINYFPISKSTSNPIISNYILISRIHIFLVQEIVSNSDGGFAKENLSFNLVYCNQKHSIAVLISFVLCWAYESKWYQQQGKATLCARTHLFLIHHLISWSLSHCLFCFSKTLTCLCFHTYKFQY